jgi:hypothetical protein
MSDLIWLSEAHMRRIEPYFHCHTGCRGSTTAG